MPKAEIEMGKAQSLRFIPQSRAVAENTNWGVTADEKGSGLPNLTRPGMGI
jgi:hypothetical protein